MAWWNILFPRRKLEGLRKATLMDLECEIDGGPSVESPRGVAGRYVHWELLKREARKWTQLSERTTGVPMLRSHGRLVALPEQGVVVHFTLMYEPLVRPLDAELCRRLGTAGAIPAASHYREHVLRDGDRVRLVGWVQPIPRGGYRTGPAVADYQALANRRKVVLVR